MVVENVRDWEYRNEVMRPKLGGHSRRRKGGQHRNTGKFE